MKRNSIFAVTTALFMILSMTACSDIAETSQKNLTNAQAAAEEKTASAGSDEAPVTDEEEQQTTTAATEAEKEDAPVTTTTQKTTASAVTASYTAYENGVLDTADMFSERDLAQQADLTEAKTLEVKDGETLSISEEGVYVITGTAKDCTVRIEADDKAKVQLVLDGVSITNQDFPAIYVVNADKCFITTAEGSENSLSVTGSFTADGDTNTDAVIFSKQDIVLNGTGSLAINSSANGISGKDDVKFTGGTYSITSAKDAIEANDSIRICGGDFTVKTDKDGLHSENDDDNTKGYIYIAGGSFKIDAGSDGIQGTTYVQIDGGTFDINASEGIEATYVQINDGTINIYATDDGINASTKSTACEICIEFNGGYTTVEVGPGDTDGIDANGKIIVNGGTIDVTGQMSTFDYDSIAEFNGGTIIVNGEEVSEIPQSMMGGPGGMRDGFPGDMGDMPDFGGGRSMNV